MTADPPADAAFIPSLDALRRRLEDDGVSPIVEEGRLVVPVRKDDFEGAVAILWPERVNLVQFALPLPISVPERRLAEVALAIARVNHALMLPGFQLDADRRLVYFRLNQPRLPDGTLWVEDLRGAFAATVSTAARHHRALAAVARGLLASRDVLDALG